MLFSDEFDSCLISQPFQGFFEYTVIKRRVTVEREGERERERERERESRSRESRSRESHSRATLKSHVQESR